MDEGHDAEEEEYTPREVKGPDAGLEGTGMGWVPWMLLLPPCGGLREHFDTLQFNAYGNGRTAWLLLMGFLLS